MDEIRGRRVWRLAAIGTALLLAAGTVVGMSMGAPGGSTAARSSAHGSPAAGRTSTIGQSNTAMVPTTGEKGGEAQSSTAGGSTAAVSADSTTVPDAGGSAGSAATPTNPLFDTGAQLPPMGQPKIVKTATVTLEVKKGTFGSAVNAVASVASGHGGYVVSTDTSVEKDRPSSGTIVLRVPVSAFDAVRNDLATLGTVKDEHLTGDDVSGQAVDLDARIRSLQAQEDAIRGLMAKATSVTDTVEIQNQLGRVRQQIEQLTAEKNRLDGAADLSTITLQLAEAAAGPAPKTAPKPHHAPSTLRHSLTLAANGVATVTAGTIVVLGWAIPLAVLALLGWAVWRLVRRSRGTRETRPAVL